MHAPPPVLAGPVTGRVSGEREILTGTEFLARVHSAARGLRAAGACAGGRVAVDVHADAPTRLCWFLGADLLGAATLLVEPAWADRERAAVLDDARPDVLVDGIPRSSSRPVTPQGTGETPFYLATTSGSSGRPRVLIRSRRSWQDSFRAFDLGVTPGGESVLVPGPLSSSLFLFAALHALHEGHDVRLLERWSATEAARACRRHTVIHLVPAMLAALLAVLERRPRLRAECTVHTVVCGGARVDDELRDRLTRILPGCALVEYYGSAEHSLVALRRDRAPLRPVDGVELDVRDGDRSVPAGTAGLLWVRSPLAFDGYLDAGAVRSPAEGGFFSVGDRAVCHGDGTLTVLGRAGATVTSGAKVIAAEEVEAVLRGVDGVADVVVSATPHPRFGALLTAVVETAPDTRPRLGALRARTRAELEPGKRPRRWLATAALPRTAAGKPARARVTEQLRAGTLVAEVLS
ncbi:long-chain acyl-CoA synthetase [Halopolyspora algeriensis]|uniref:Long-chain acyl-CoA synthetase n=1 Tax=Halopolyspora algeriensis TaxID=1500506 RepID=A0A368VPI1_9ACTN|nr:AMP-binding protein [Halopolyspora algeriensis]RCW42895.1 long-chain acyl-CoA synthetase [Halopolyspora algeriensis]TQM56636.1 long-chain acyl-CoA synthetase [Halopolyspora algeriensis]